MGQNRTRGSIRWWPWRWFTPAQLKYPEFDALLRDYLDRLDPVHDSLGTYQAGILCMLIGDYADPRYLPKMRLLAQSLVEQQLADGPLHGTGRPVPEAAFGDYKSGPALSVAGGQPLDYLALPAGKPLTRVQDFEQHLPGDNSTSQFAMLGLRAASCVRIHADPQVWSRAMQSFAGRHCAMVAGVISPCDLRLRQHQPSPASARSPSPATSWVRKTPPTTPRSRRGSVADAHFSVCTNPEQGSISITTCIRSSALAGSSTRSSSARTSGTRWAPSSWSTAAEQGPLLGRSRTRTTRGTSTSFALLFLTLRDADAERAGSSTRRPGHASAPSRRSAAADAALHHPRCFRLDAGRHGRRQKFDLARYCRPASLGRLPDSTRGRPRVYGHRKRSLEPGSDEDTAAGIPSRARPGVKLAAKLK